MSLSSSTEISVVSCWSVPSVSLGRTLTCPISDTLVDLQTLQKEHAMWGFNQAEILKLCVVCNKLFNLYKNYCFFFVNSTIFYILHNHVTIHISDNPVNCCKYFPNERLFGT